MTDKEAQVQLAIMQSKMMITDDRRPALIRGLNAIKNKVAQQTEIEELKAQLAAAEKKAYWQGFETGSINQGGNILMHYNDWLELRKVNAEYADNQQGDNNGE